MASEWRKVRLGDLARIEHGWPFQSELFSHELSGRPIVVGIGNFDYSGGFRFDSTALKEYRGEYPAAFDLQPGDLLLVMTCQTAGGEILGIPARIPDDGRRYLHNQRLGKLIVTNPSAVCPEYLYWLFLTREFNQHLVNTATGTKILHTAPSRIESFEFLLPPLPEQRRIAGILGALDDKIDLNRRMSQTLESMARALFKSWFVDFDPVRAKAEGREPDLSSAVADLFPDSFVDSPLGVIPAGWCIRTISDVCQGIFSGGTPRTDTRTYWGGDLPWLSSGETRSKFIVSTENTITRQGLVESSTRLARAGATVIASAGQGHTRGQTSMLMLDAYVNQSVVALLGDPHYTSDDHLFFDLERRYEEFRQASDGHSSRGSLTTKLLGERLHVSPPIELVERFHAMVGPMVEDIGVRARESQMLSALRDALLPVLMSDRLSERPRGGRHT
jgi:type I restriction enzyme S subunit